MENKKGIYQVTENPLETSGRPASLYFTSKFADEVGSEFIADFENPINARFVCKCLNDRIALQAKCERYEAALKMARHWVKGATKLSNEEFSNMAIVDLKIIDEALSAGEGEKQVELSCMVCNKSFMGPEPKMCCSGQDCGCMGMPIDPVVCSKQCYDNLPGKKIRKEDKNDFGVFDYKQMELEKGEPAPEGAIQAMHERWNKTGERIECSHCRMWIIPGEGCPDCKNQKEDKQ